MHHPNCVNPILTWISLMMGADMICFHLRAFERNLSSHAHIRRRSNKSSWILGIPVTQTKFSKFLSFARAVSQKNLFEFPARRIIWREKWSKNLAKHLVRHSPNFDGRKIREWLLNIAGENLAKITLPEIPRQPTKSFPLILYFLIRRKNIFVFFRPALAVRIAKTRNSHWFALNL